MHIFFYQVFSDTHPFCGQAHRPLLSGLTSRTPRARRPMSPPLGLKSFNTNLLLLSTFHLQLCDNRGQLAKAQDALSAAHKDLAASHEELVQARESVLALVEIRDKNAALLTQLAEVMADAQLTQVNREQVVVHFLRQCPSPCRRCCCHGAPFVKGHNPMELDVLVSDHGCWYYTQVSPGALALTMVPT